LRAKLRNDQQAIDNKQLGVERHRLVLSRRQILPGNNFRAEGKYY